MTNCWEGEEILGSLAPFWASAAHRLSVRCCCCCLPKAAVCFCCAGRWHRMWGAVRHGADMVVCILL